MVRKGFESEVKLIRDEANDKIEWLSNNLFHPDFIKVVEWLKKEQKYRFNNNCYSKDDGENL